jgi:enterochelin esterase-like enzyme
MPATTIRVRYSLSLGSVGLRGTAPLSWQATAPPTRREGSLHIFELDLPEGHVLDFKPVRGDDRFAAGRNATVLAGETVELEPYFDATKGTLDEAPRRILSNELAREILFRVFLPPGYRECDARRYPVLYALDGQSLFSEWRLDATLNDLWSLGAMAEAIVVAVHSDVERLGMLSPTKDAAHGGGDGPKTLAFLTDTLKPYVDTFFRTRRGREDTAILGSSMGGLFAFYAAWTRPDVFGKAACLSSSFWWDRRAMVREVERGACPFPPPLLYVDSGAAKNATEEDANLRDGYHHTMALRKALVGHCYEPGRNLHVLAFPGHAHDAVSWGGRLGVPLQVLFPA